MKLIIKIHIFLFLINILHSSPVFCVFVVGRKLCGVRDVHLASTMKTLLLVKRIFFTFSTSSKQPNQSYHPKKPNIMFFRCLVDVYFSFIKSPCPPAFVIFFKATSATFCSSLSASL